MKPLAPKTSMLSYPGVLRKNPHVSHAHPDLHRAIYLSCLPAVAAGINAAVYYYNHGDVSRPSFSTSGLWAIDTYAAPWVAILACFAASALFVSFAKHRNVRGSSKKSTAAILGLAWLGTFFSFLIVD